ncbi:MAG: two-component system cell cycle response regulator [Candidatus Promineifilaceae bacterium]|jgi:two-component system cell cycle response regulator
MNTPQDSATFKSTFGARIDTIEVAIRALEEGFPESEFAIRRLSHTVGGPASHFGMSALFEASQKTQRALIAELPDAARALISALREAASDVTMRQSRILIVGGMPQLNTAIKEHLGSPSRHVIDVDTAARATEELSKAPISCIILSVILPDLDSRAFFVSLRENPLTASTPVLFVGVRISDQIKEHSQLHQADGYYENPRGADDIVTWVNDRLRRTPEPLRPSRRDVLTGLLNQAAMREAFNAAQDQRAKSKEPLTLACIAVDSSRNLLSAFCENTREEILQTMSITLSSNLRAYDCVSRWGTYEFVVLLPGEDTFGGTRAMDKVLEQFRHQCVNPSNPAPHDLSVAIGVTSVELDTSCDDAISAAEHLVYQATKMGANHVVSDRSVSETKREHRILILSADDATKTILAGMMEKYGFPCVAFSTLEQALSSDLESEYFHLVIIDQNFPPSGGFGVLEQLRGDSKNNRLPIVMLISENVEENVTKALDLGANDYLIRPFSPNHLVGYIRRLLSRRSQTTTPANLVRLLIVDSDQKSLVLSATVLHQRGIQVYLADSVESAIERFPDIKPSAIIADITSSPEDVKHLAKRLDEQRDISSIPFILLCAPAQEELSLSFLPANVAGQLTKPLDPIRLSDQIESILLLPSSATRTESSLEHLNAEIHRVMHPDD